MNVKGYLERFDDFQQRHAFLGFPIAVAKKFGEDQAGNLAALIAYYAFFSIFPLLLAFVTILGYVLSGNGHLQQQISNGAFSAFPGPLRSTLTSNVHTLHGNPFALAVGVAGALWGGLGVANVAQTAMNTVWAVPMVKRPNFLWRTLRSIGLLVVVGVGMIATTIGSSIVTAHGILGPAASVGAVIVTVALDIGMFWVAFHILVDRDLSWRQLMVGAIFAGVAWVILQYVGGYYVTHALKNAQQTYATFAIVIGLLSWFYLEAQVMLYAMEIDVVRVARLWPRNLIGNELTPADERAYAGYADINQYKPNQKIETRYDPKQMEDTQQERSDRADADGQSQARERRSAAAAARDGSGAHRAGEPATRGGRGTSSRESSGRRS